MIKKLCRQVGLLVCLLLAAGVLASSAMAAGEVIEVNVGDTFQVAVQLSGGEKVSAGLLKVVFEFRPLDGSVDYQLDVQDVVASWGYDGGLIGGDIYLTSEENVFSGQLCTVSMVLSEYGANADTGMLTYSIQANGAEVASGIQVIWVKNRSSERSHGASARQVTVGSRIEMGYYEQDDVFSNGKEPIVWRVLVVEKDRALLISDQVLDQQVYHPKQTAVTWETCHLRGWLNSTFYREAFTAEEQEQILEVVVPAHESPYYHDESSRKSIGNPTRDKIFLLSAREANEYFSSDWDRIAYPTKYALFRGVKADSVNEPCSWFLRQPHKHRTNTAAVNQEGRTNDGANVSYDGSGLRPAMWIKLP